MKVQCPGVSKIPAQLVAKLDSGTTYMLCFDGEVSWSESPYKVGAGACFFQIHTDGRRNLHMGNWDATVFWKADRVLLEEVDFRCKSALNIYYLSFPHPLPDCGN